MSEKSTISKESRSKKKWWSFLSWKNELVTQIWKLSL